MPKSESIFTNILTWKEINFEVYKHRQTVVFQQARKHKIILLNASNFIITKLGK